MNLDRYNERRINLLKRRKKYYIISIFLISLIAVITRNLEIVLQIIIFGSIFLFSSIKIPEEKLKKNLKEDLIKKAIEDKYPSLSYNSKKGISKDDYLKSKTFKLGKETFSTDLVSGVYKGVELEYSSFYTKTTIRTDDSSHTVVYFKGKFFKAKLKKPVETELYLTETSKPIGLFKYTRISSESILFNKVFKAYVEREDKAFAHNAFKILTPTAIERFLAFEEEYKGNIKISFIGDVLYIAINNMVDYQLNLKEEFTMEKLLYLNDIETVVDIVNDLDVEEI